MKQFSFLILLLITACTTNNKSATAASDQNKWYDKYLACAKDSDIHAWKALIEEWEQAEPESPDVYAA